MIRNEVVSKISQQTGVSKTDCDKVLDGLADVVTNALVDGEEVIIRRFMTFEVNQRPERSGRNPRTGEIITFPSMKSVKCRISKVIKDAVNGISGLASSC